MKEDLIIEDNTIYEIDPNCVIVERKIRKRRKLMAYEKKKKTYKNYMILLWILKRK